MLERISTKLILILRSGQSGLSSKRIYIFTSLRKLLFPYVAYYKNPAAVVIKALSRSNHWVDARLSLCVFNAHLEKYLIRLL